MQMYPTKVNRVKPVPSPIMSLGNRVTKASFNKSGCNCSSKKYTHNNRSKIGFR